MRDNEIKNERGKMGGGENDRDIKRVSESERGKRLVRIERVRFRERARERVRKTKKSSICPVGEMFRFDFQIKLQK